MRSSCALVLVVALTGCERGQVAGEAREGLSAAISTVAPIGGGNAMTLPAQRHLVRLLPGGAPRWLLAVQQDGAGGHGLGFFRSDDDGASFHYYAPIQDDPSERDTTDLITVGNDVALVYSYEGPMLSGSDRHDVYFQWWRWNGSDFVPQPALLVFDSTSNASAYYRAELQRDSFGRLWVQAFRLNADGSATARIAVSSDGGAHFGIEPDLGSFPTRGGGRLTALGARMVFVWDGHDGVSTPSYRVRNDADAVDTWGPTATAFPEGIYHGASISAVPDGAGGMHFVYKDKSFQQWYRHFDGATFGPGQSIETQGDWELQEAVTRVGSDVWIFYNRVITSGYDDEVRVRKLSGGVVGPPTVLDGSASFKGYPAAVEVLPSGAARVPCVWGVTPNADVGGQLELYAVGVSGGAPPPDLSAPADLGAPADLAARSDLAAPPAGSLLFSDDFNRNASSLGARWSVGAGTFYTDGRAVSDHSGGDRATENASACSDCRVQVSVLGFGVAETGVFLRAPSAGSGDRYDFVLLSNAHVQIRRVRAGAITVLGDVLSGIAALDQPATLSLQATGTSPVTLVGRVNGLTRLSVSDGSAQALASGWAGLSTTNAGVVFDDFALWSVAGSAASPPDFGMAPPPDLSTAQPDLSTAQPADLASPPSGTLFSDHFDRSGGSLGADWSVGAGTFYADGRAVSDHSGGDRVTELAATCADCRVQASVIGFGVPETGVFLRSPSVSSPDRYDFVLLSNAHVQIRRVRSGVITVLADAPSGVSALDEPTTLALQSTGSAPVTLTGQVNGSTRVTASDGGAQALAPGYAGLWTTNAGVVFDDFVLAN